MRYAVTANVHICEDYKAKIDKDVTEYINEPKPVAPVFGATGFFFFWRSVSALG